MSLMGNGVRMVSGTTERDTTKSKAIDRVYGLISRSDLRTVPPPSGDARDSAELVRARASSRRRREATTAQPIHATAGAKIRRNRRWKTEKNERPKSQSCGKRGTSSWWFATR